ncbi:unnamed protein product [Closterium sp. NIES-53]
MVHQVLKRFGFEFSLPQSTPLPTGHSLSAPPSDESVEPSGPYPELVGCLITSSMGLVLGGRGPVVLTGHADASWVDDLATQRLSQGYTFNLGSGSVSWRSTRSSSVLSSSCEAEIYAGAMAAQELHWLTYLLTDLGEWPRSLPVLYVDNKAMIALCKEHRLEHRTKHIALRFFLARELQQRGQLRLAYVATWANTADIFTKALQPDTRVNDGATGGSGVFEMSSHAHMCQRYSFATVAKATENWAKGNHIGSGAYGEVYRGVCPDDPSVVWAVKRAKILTNYFKREVRRQGPKKGTLSLQRRMDVLVGVARGLEYLHHFDIVHRDIKAANVLLDARMQVREEVFNGGREGGG